MEVLPHHHSIYDKDDYDTSKEIKKYLESSKISSWGLGSRDPHMMAYHNQLKDFTTCMTGKQLFREGDEDPPPHGYTYKI